MPLIPELCTRDLYKHLGRLLKCVWYKTVINF